MNHWRSDTDFALLTAGRPMDVGTVLHLYLLETGEWSSALWWECGNERSNLSGWRPQGHGCGRAEESLCFHCFMGFFIYFLESIANLIVHFVAACILFQIRVQFVCFLSFLIQVWLSQKSKSFFLQMERTDRKHWSLLALYNYRDSSFVNAHLQGHGASIPIFHSTYKAVRVCSCNALHLKFVYC